MHPDYKPGRAKRENRSQVLVGALSGVWTEGVAIWCSMRQYEMLCEESAARHQRALETNENAGHRRERWTLINQPFFFGRSPAFAMPRSADGRNKRCLNPSQAGEVPVAHQPNYKKLVVVGSPLSQPKPAQLQSSSSEIRKVWAPTICCRVL